MNRIFIGQNVNGKPKWTNRDIIRKLNLNKVKDKSFSVLQNNIGYWEGVKENTTIIDCNNDQKIISWIKIALTNLKQDVVLLLSNKKTFNTGKKLITLNDNYIMLVEISENITKVGNILKNVFQGLTLINCGKYCCLMFVGNAKEYSQFIKIYSKVKKMRNFKRIKKQEYKDTIYSYWFDKNKI